MTSFIKIRWDFVGFHRYSGAPAEVQFLENVHRHSFKCSALIEVFHDNRELEFFIVQKKLKAKYPDGTFVGSCEMVCKDVIQFLQSYYGNNRFYEIEVSEDGENSAVVRTS